MTERPDFLSRKDRYRTVHTRVTFDGEHFVHGFIQQREETFDELTKLPQGRLPTVGGEYAVALAESQMHAFWAARFTVEEPLQVSGELPPNAHRFVEILTTVTPGLFEALGLVDPRLIGTDGIIYQPRVPSHGSGNLYIPDARVAVEIVGDAAYGIAGGPRYWAIYITVDGGDSVYQFTRAVVESMTRNRIPADS